MQSTVIHDGNVILGSWRQSVRDRELRHSLLVVWGRGVDAENNDFGNRAVVSNVLGIDGRNGRSYKKTKINNVDRKKGKERRDPFVVQTIFVAIENTKDKIIN